MATTRPLLLLLLQLQLLLSVAMALQFYEMRIPNGDRVVENGVSYTAIGHYRSSSKLNNFGRDFSNAGHGWTIALCQTDSDGDGKTNGFELGDPECVWSIGATPARTTDITHPGGTDAAGGLPSTAVTLALLVVGALLMNL